MLRREHHLQSVHLVIMRAWVWFLELTLNRKARCGAQVCNPSSGEAEIGRSQSLLARQPSYCWALGQWETLSQSQTKPNKPKQGEGNTSGATAKAVLWQQPAHTNTVTVNMYIRRTCIQITHRHVYSYQKCYNFGCFDSEFSETHLKFSVNIENPLKQFWSQLFG